MVVPALPQALVTPLASLSEARDCAAASLSYLGGLQSDDLATGPGAVVLRTVTLDGDQTSLRPLNIDLFIEETEQYLEAFAEFEELVAELARQRESFPDDRKAEVRASGLISRVLYTTLQAIGCAMDCLLTANTARKNYGMRFEELMRDLLSDLGIGQRSIQFSLPYTGRAGVASTFTNQVDLVIAPEGEVASRPNFLAPDEVVVSLKTSSKDRFAKIFLDQELLSFVTGQPIKVIALFHNDIQRSRTTRTSVTFVAGNFAAYVARFGDLTGVYYVDPPPHIEREPWKHWLRRYDDLLLDDLWNRIF